MLLRSTLLYLTILSIFFSSVFAKPPRDDECTKIDQELRPRLSSKASIVHYTSAAPRWSDYHAPKPGTIVNIANENDVVETVKYCVKNNLDFLTQSGGHGYATTFHIGKKDVVINMRGLNKVSISANKDTITFEGGAIVDEIVNTAYANQVETALPGCSCVGISGATLGGGFNRLMGKYGFVIDNLLSIKMVTAKGELIIVTPESYPDLWFALRGAGANFGVVTSMTMKAYQPINNGIGWLGIFTFSPDKLEELVQTLSDFDTPPEMYHGILINQSPPDFTPTLSYLCQFAGSEADAKAAIKPILDIGPMGTTIDSEIPWDQFHHVLDPSCPKGNRKPVYSSGLKKADPTAFRKIWDDYVSLVTQYPEMNQTIFLIETYSHEKIRTFPDDSSAFPHRRFNFLVSVIPNYEDASLDPVAEEFGENVRQLWIDTSGFKEFRAYINYGHGDEAPEVIYGENLRRLKKIKKVWDKQNRFGQYFPIPRS